MAKCQKVDDEKTPPIELGGPWEWPPQRKRGSHHFTVESSDSHRESKALSAAGTTPCSVKGSGMAEVKSLASRETLLMKKILFTSSWDAKRHGSILVILSIQGIYTHYVTICQLVDAILSIESSQKWIQTIFGFGHHPLTSRTLFVRSVRKLWRSFLPEKWMICKSQNMVCHGLPFWF